MPSNPKIPKDVILQTAIEMLIRDGYESINIKSVAKELGCSTQPISWQFGGMEGFRRELATAAVKYAGRRMMSDSSDPVESFYKIGEAYIDMAFDLPNLVRFITSTSDGHSRGGGFLSIFDIESIENKASTIASAIKLPLEKVQDWMEHCIIYTHGIVMLLISGILTKDRQTAKKMVRETGIQYLIALGVPTESLFATAG